MNNTVELTLSGRVQGVGMRFFINRSATKFGITGYVKNLYNGTVLAVLQGNQNLIEEFIDYMKMNSPGIIDNIAFNQLDTDITYTKFTVKIF